MYKPAPKNAKPKRTNRKPLAQGQLVDLNNPRSAKNYKNGMKSLLIGTLEHNHLSADIQRRETISTPGQASPFCKVFDKIDSESRRATLVPSLTPTSKQRLPLADGLFSPLRKITEDVDDFQSPHRTINLDLSDAEFDDKINDTEKENRNKVDVFMADVLDDSNRNFHNKSFESLDLSVCKEDSIAKVICHTPRSVKKKLLQSPVSDCNKNPCKNVPTTEKESSSFFNKDTDTTLINDMNATQVPNDSSESEEDLNSKKLLLLKKSTSKVKKGRIVPSRYMQSARNFVAAKTPVKKSFNKSLNVTLNRGNCKNLSVVYSGSKNSSDEPDDRLATCHPKSKSDDGTNNAQTSTPNKDDLPMPYSDASSIMQDISTISEADRTIRRDLFHLDAKNKAAMPLFPTMEQEKKSKPTVDQMDLEILYSQYIRSLYLNTMFQHSFQKREEEAMIQMHGLWSEMEKIMKTKSNLELKLVEEEHNKVVSQTAQRQSNALNLVDFSLPDLIHNHQHLAAALDTTRHQIASHGIHLPKDEEAFTDDLIESLQETEQLLKKINDFTGENGNSLSSYSSVLKELTDTACQENNEIEKLDEILAATESLTVHQASLNVQEVQDLCTMKFQLNI